MAEVVRLPRGEEPFVHLHRHEAGWRVRVMHCPKLRAIGGTHPTFEPAFKVAMQFALAENLPMLLETVGWEGHL